MKSSWLFPHVLFFVVVLWAQDSHAQDYTRWNLPEGAFLRLGKGWILGGDRTVAYSPDGQMLAVASIIGIWIYDAHTGAELNFFGGSKELGVGPLAFSPDETTLAGGGFWEDKVWLWDVATGQLKATFEGRSVYVRSLAFSPDGATLAVTSHDLATDTIRVWDVASGGQAVTMAPPFPVQSLAFSSDGATIALGGYGQGESKAKTLQLWDVTSGQQKTSLGGSETVNSVAFSPDGAILASADDYGVDLWDMATHQVKDKLPNLKGEWEVLEPRVPLCCPRYPVNCLAFSPGGDILATGSGLYTVALWNVSGEGQIRSLLNHTASVSALAFSPNGSRVASAGGDNRVRVWDVTSGQEKFTLEHTDQLSAVAFSPDGASVVGAGSYSGSYGVSSGRIRVWDVASGQIQATLDGLEPWPYNTVVFSPDGTTVAFLTGINRIQLLDVASGQIWAAIRPDMSVRSLAISPDQSTLAIGGDVEEGSSGVALKVWDVDKGEIISLQGAYSYVRAVAFSPDGATLASTGRDVQLWDVASGQLKATLIGHKNGARSLAFSPDGAILASGGRSPSFAPYETSVLLWDVASGQLRGSLEDHKTSVHPLLFSPDGTILVSGGGGFRLWDVASGQLKGTLKASGIAFSFSPDGETLASGSQDGTVLLWDMTPYLPSSTPTAIESPSAPPPTHATLQPNRPNPFNDHTQISYRLAAPGEVRLVIYNTLGQPVRTLVDQWQTAGQYQVFWDARDLRGERVSTGVYLARLLYPGGEQTQRLLYLR